MNRVTTSPCGVPTAIHLPLPVANDLGWISPSEEETLANFYVMNPERELRLRDHVLHQVGQRLQPYTAADVRHAVEAAQAEVAKEEKELAEALAAVQRAQHAAEAKRAALARASRRQQDLSLDVESTAAVRRGVHDQDVEPGDLARVPGWHDVAVTGIGGQLLRTSPYRTRTRTRRTF